MGERTAANGFIEGYIIKGGKFKKELGGGVSQSATTTFNAMFFAGLKDIQHQPHTLYIDRYPAGREATVAWPSLDLKFQNDTKYGVLVQAYRVKGSPGPPGLDHGQDVVDQDLRQGRVDRPGAVELHHRPRHRGRLVRLRAMAPVQGFDVSYARLFYNDGKVVKRENFSWRYAPTDRVRCV